MNTKIKLLLVITLTNLTQLLGNNCNCDGYAIKACQGYPFLQTRSQGSDTARQITLPQEFINRYDAQATYGLFSATAEYNQSFNNKKIANFLFGKDLANCQDLYIQGGLVENRNPNAWLAEYFGLPNDYNSKVVFNPKVQNFIIDLDLYVGLDGLAEGLYFRLNAPLAWTKNQLGTCETVIADGENPFVAGYMSTTTIERADLPSNFLEFMNGKTTFGDMQTPLKFGKINDCDLSNFTAAQINMEFGYNFISKQNYNLGLAIYSAIPTGNRPTAKKLFEPIVGNGKHWELGFDLTGSWIFYRNKNYENRYIGLWLEAIVTHLFAACQTRSFDFCNKPNSRYMLLEQMLDTNYITPADGQQEQPLTGDQPKYTPCDYQYSGNLIPAINWSTIQVNVKIPVQADMSIKFGATRDNWDFDLGYNFWARSGEKFCPESCLCDSDNFYAIKGDATLYGKYGQDNTIVPIAQTENNASIHGLTPRVIDNAQSAYYTVIATPSNINEPIAIIWAPVFAPITTSVQPIILDKSMLNTGKSPSSITHKIFTNLGYACKERNSRFIPAIAIGAFAEFFQESSCTPRGAISLWGAWIRGAVSFD